MGRLQSDHVFCPRPCPLARARLCSYAAWFAQPPHEHARSLLDLSLGSRCIQIFLRFRIGVHRLTKDGGLVTDYFGMRGYVCIATRGHCVMRNIWCFSAQLYKALVYNAYAFLLLDMCTMKHFLWQDDLVDVAKFIHACLDKKVFSCTWLVQ